MMTAINTRYAIAVVGGGLAGLSSVISAAKLLPASHKICLIDKEKKPGGNSAKATSGINGACTSTQVDQEVVDRVDWFVDDTSKSAQEGGEGHAKEELINVLCSKSSDAIEFLKEFGIPLDALTQLGGHGVKRTHRCPPDAQGRPVPIGFTIVNTLLKYIQTELKDVVDVISGAKAEHVIVERGKVVGLNVVDVDSKEESQLECGALILTTGGFAFDKSAEGLIAKYRPDLLGFATTNGSWATGDGIHLGEKVGAMLIDMNQIQLHPTGFVDPKNPTSATKFLAPEALRGSGGILINEHGDRFVDELGYRSTVSNEIIRKCKDKISFCILNEVSQKLFGIGTLGFYHQKLGLFEQCRNVAEIAKLVGCREDSIVKTLKAYHAAVEAKRCKLTGKTVFPCDFKPDDSNYLVSRVTPVIHYCMGGLEISPAAEVIGKTDVIPGLYAAGEVTGGVHGGNRLGGNSLLECVVFGRIAGAEAVQYISV